MQLPRIQGDVSCIEWQVISTTFSYPVISKGNYWNGMNVLTLRIAADRSCSQSASCMANWAMLRKYRIGQFVGYPSNPRERPVSRNIYRITSLLPPREGGGEPEYLIKNSTEGYERVVKESDLVQLARSVNENTPTRRR